MVDPESVYISDAAQMLAYGNGLGASLTAGMIVFLEGPLGAGKTTLVRGVLCGMGYHGAVRSPTYTLVESYETERFPVHHFDLYRLGHPEELEDMGIRDYVGSEALCLIEWPERGAGILPEADLQVSISYRDSGRQVSLISHHGR